MNKSISPTLFSSLKKHIEKTFNFSRRFSPRLQLSRGFTIVELLIVVVVIAILAAITIVAYNGIQNKAEESALLSEAQQAGKKILMSAVSNGDTLPATATAAGLTDTSNVTYQYTPNTTVTPNSFCVTTTSGTTSYHISGTTGGVSAATAGPCTGHTGTVPTVLADGSSCPAGYIVVPGSSLYNTEAFCVMKYEAKNNGSGVAVSTMVGTPWATISQTNALTVAEAACSGCHLITENEWLTIAQNVMSVDSNWSGGSVGTGSMYRGHTDNVPANSLAASTDNDGYSGTGQTTAEQRRTLTLTNAEIIWDLAGNVWEWTDGTTEGAGKQPASSGASYGWRQWSTASLLPGNFANTFPEYASASASAWGSSQNIGQLYSSNTEGALRGFRRGGYWIDGGNGGVFSLILDSAPSFTHVALGFRVAK